MNVVLRLDYKYHGLQVFLSKNKVLSNGELDRVESSGEFMFNSELESVYLGASSIPVQFQEEFKDGIPKVFSIQCKNIGSFETPSEFFNKHYVKGMSFEKMMEEAHKKGVI